MSSPEGLKTSKEQSTSDLEVNQPRTAKEWEREILFQICSSVSKFQKKTEVKQTQLITDARELFGSDMKEKVSLRTTEDHRMGRPIVLKQFDPNLKAQKVVCRHPKCKIVKPESNVGEGKRDLYLCLGHRKKLGDYIMDICARKKVDVQVSLQPKKGIFEGYTSMIGYLDQAYLDCMTSPGSSPMGWSTDPLVKEVIINVRNYFMIVNAVLNPDDENLGIALPPVYQILTDILAQCTNREITENLVYLLKEVVLTILFTFGVLYTWVPITHSDPGAKIGAGLGGIIGGVAGFFGGGPLTAVGVAGAGAVFGGLIGSGIYSLFRGHPQHDNDLQQFRLFWSQSQGQTNADVDGENEEEYQAFSFTGSSLGDLALVLVWISFHTSF